MLSSLKHSMPSSPSILCRTSPAFTQTRNVNNAEMLRNRPTRAAQPAWFRRRGAHPGYPSFFYPTSTRIAGVDKNLQERLDDLFKEENELRKNRVNIGFPIIKQTAAQTRAKLIEKRSRRANPELERSARLGKLNVSVEQVKSEHLKNGGIFKDIAEAADLYGIFEDLYGVDKFFRPCVYLNVHYDFDDDFVTPVHRGNVIKPKEATTAPRVTFSLPDEHKEENSLWTLVLTNLDGHFTQENSEYLHWMVGNIPGNNFSAGKTFCNYLQPFPAAGTGYHRHAFVLYKQSKELDLSEYADGLKVKLSKRTFSTRDFLQKFDGQLIPSGLAFFQSDWDSSLKDFFHNVLEMREPRFEYNFVPSYIKPWLSRVPDNLAVPFNLFLDMHRDPKEIQEEVLKKKLKTIHPFKGDLERHLRFRNAHGPQFHRYQDQDKYGSWRLREIERERLRQGIYKDMDWTALRKDPSDA